MPFQLRRYYYGLVKYKTWLLLFLIPPVLFILATALIPSQYTVNQHIHSSVQTPVALLSSPTGTLPAREFVTQPDKLFLNPFALRALYAKLHPGVTDYRTDPRFPALADAVQKHMALHRIDDNTLQIGYSGPDQELGSALVAFFSERWIQYTMEGVKRSGMALAPDQKPGLAGSATISAQRTLLPAMYIKSFVQTLLFSLLGALVLAGILEFNDASFKSERQMAEYLKLPILGSLPNLERVYSAMEE